MLTSRAPLSCCHRVLDQINPASCQPTSPPEFSMELLDPELEMLGRQQIPLAVRKQTILDWFRTARATNADIGSTIR